MLDKPKCPGEGPLVVPGDKHTHRGCLRSGVANEGVNNGNNLALCVPPPCSSAISIKILMVPHRVCVSHLAQVQLAGWASTSALSVANFLHCCLPFCCLNSSKEYSGARDAYGAIYLGKTASDAAAMASHGPAAAGSSSLHRGYSLDHKQAGALAVGEVAPIQPSVSCSVALLAFMCSNEHML